MIRLFSRSFLLSIFFIPWTFSFSYAQATGNARFLGQFSSPRFYRTPTNTSYVSGCWGWADSLSGREYALVGNPCGTSIVEITEPDSLVERAFIDGPCSRWREIQTHSHYAYVVSEGGGGTQIIDLSYLPDSVHLVTNFTYFLDTSSTTRAHSILINNGFMFLNGCATWKRGRAVVIFDLFDPESPTFAWDYSNGNYIHDSFVHNDTLYAAAVYGVGIEVVDVTSKTSPRYLYTISYTGSGSHNCATTTDGRYLLTTDEIGTTPKTLKFWDIQNPPSYFMAAEYVGSPTAIVHNVFVKDTLAIMSYYTKGVKIVNIKDPTTPVEIGGYDTYPSSDVGAYDGAWSVYPFFPSGKIIIGDMASGLYVIDLNNAPTAVQDEPVPAEFLLLQNYPNPFNPSTRIRYQLPIRSTVRLDLHNSLGQLVAIMEDGVKPAGVHSIVWDGMGSPSGVYFARLTVFDAAGLPMYSSSNKLLLLR